MTDGKRREAGRTADETLLPTQDDIAAKGDPVRRGRGMVE